MKMFLGILCVALVTQLGAVLGEAELKVPERFKVGQALQFDQDAGDKAAFRSITSSDPAEFIPASVQTSMTPENSDFEAQEKAEEAQSEIDELQKLAERSIDDFEANNQLESEEGVEAEAEADQDLDARGLFESGMNMVPSSIRDAASSLGQKAANIRETAANIYNNPQAARESIGTALNNAKEKVLSPEVRQKMQDMYKNGLDQGINAYKALNKQLSPSMARTLNQGVSSALRGVQAARESNIAKSISDKITSLLP